ncbi:hypothetical protein Aperf_G00000028905 [Anoplocephala perfoliata]
MAQGQKTFFDNFPKAINPDDILKVEVLVQFAEEIVVFCDKQGIALTPVKNDIKGNIAKINSACEKLGVSSVGEILVKERETGVIQKDSSGSVGVLWLSRAVELIIEVMAELIVNPDGQMSDIAKSAYEKTLKKHHTKVMTALFFAGLKMFPDRKTFLYNLANNQPNMEDQVMEAMSDFLKRYGNILRPIKFELAKYGLETKPE